MSPLFPFKCVPTRKPSGIAFRRSLRGHKRIIKAYPHPEWNNWKIDKYPPGPDLALTFSLLFSSSSEVVRSFTILSFLFYVFFSLFIENLNSIAVLVVFSTRELNGNAKRDEPIPFSSTTRAFPLNRWWWCVHPGHTDLVPSIHRNHPEWAR